MEIDLVPVLTMVFFIPLGVIVPFIWPAIFAGVVKAGAAFTAMGPIGTFLYGFTARLLNVFGLHHAVYPPILVYRVRWNYGSSWATSCWWSKNFLCSAC